jgi:carbamoyl-phosphate synthase/aspartate carbamoyltransferase/dihydroorotase
MTTIRLPGLIDAHVHLREPGYTHKEDFYSGTVAALAGGVTTVLDMPNTQPPTATPARLREKVALAQAKAVCDVGLFVGATSTDLDAYLPVAQAACGLKIYVSETFGSLRIDELGLLHRFFRTWAEKGDAVGYRSRGRADGIGPIAVHAEEMMLSVCLQLSHLYHVPLHIVHVTRRSEIELIAQAKARDYPVTCEVTPHHLFLTDQDAIRLGALGDMRPRLATADDVAAMWEHLAIVDIFATDHAPHTLEEKTLATPPPGVPGLETMLPLLLTAVHEGRLDLADIVERCVDAPRRIYGLPPQPDTYVDVDVDTAYRVQAAALHSKVKWTPFANQQLFGRIERVVLRGTTVFADGELLADEGSGTVIFSHLMNKSGLTQNAD